jgi:hypothetical protein
LKNIHQNFLDAEFDLSYPLEFEPRMFYFPGDEIDRLLKRGDFGWNNEAGWTFHINAHHWEWAQ